MVWLMSVIILLQNVSAFFPIVFYLFMSSLFLFLLLHNHSSGWKSQFCSLTFSKKIKLQSQKLETNGGYDL